jgi:hypothetical protein
LEGRSQVGRGGGMIRIERISNCRLLFAPLSRFDTVPGALSSFKIILT